MGTTQLHNDSCLDGDKVQIICNVQHCDCSGATLDSGLFVIWSNKLLKIISTLNGVFPVTRKVEVGPSAGRYSNPNMSSKLQVARGALYVVSAPAACSGYLLN